MASNLSKYEADIKRLVREGQLLLVAMQQEQRPEDTKQAYTKALGDKAEDFFKSLPSFRSAYQKWYSEAKALIRQIIPDRLADFVRHYERLPNRKMLQWDNYTVEDYLQGLSRSDIVPMTAGIARVEQQVAILESAQQRFKSSLFDIRQLVAADLFDSEIDTAKVLAKNKFLRAAGAVVGVVLEKHLAQVCESHNLKVAKKNPGIADLNELLKSSDVIDTPTWRFIQHLADIRNICDHNKNQEPTAEQIDDLVNGAAKMLKTLF